MDLTFSFFVDAFKKKVNPNLFCNIIQTCLNVYKGRIIEFTSQDVKQVNRRNNQRFSPNL